VQKQSANLQTSALSLEIAHRGLSSEEVARLTAQKQQNIFVEPNSRRVAEIFAENLFSVFNLIVALIIGTLLFFWFRTGDARLPLDAIGVLAIAAINTTLAVIQEIRAKNALAAVNLLLKRQITVVRDGILQEIEQTAIVKGDLIRLARGDQIAVDGKIVEANHLEIDESLLTGESLPIEKTAGDAVLSGSFCIAGNGYYLAEKVGNESLAAHITGTARGFKLYQSPLQRRINFIVKALFAVSLVLIALEIFSGARGGTISEVDDIRRLATIAISLVPHGLVLMSSITFALGIYRISQLGAIVQRLNAIESFSNVQIVCTDKTGTLTQNRLAVRRVSVVDESGITQHELERFLGIFAALSSEKNATLRTLEKFAPLLSEFLRAGASVKLLNEIPFDSAAKLSAVEVELDGRPEIFVFGGFDVLSDRISIPGLRGKAERIVRDAKLEVYRNLFFGRAEAGASLENIRQNTAALKFEPLGIVSISDEIRADVFEAIKLFQFHRIEIKILSGDAADAVRAVANEIGWQIAPEKIISGAQLDALDETEFVKAAREKLIFARLKPEHKLRLIKTYRAQKIYTAMIGDGVNDLPAIKEADLGIAMEEGSQITKEVADIVLLKNKFALLPQIFYEGNRIVNTVNSIAKLFLSKIFFVIYLALAALYFGWTFPLTPRRVALINIFTIALPSFVIALKNRDATKTRNFTFDLFSFVAISGFFICVAGFFAQSAAEIYFAPTDDEVQMVMLSVMTITSIANFFIVVLRGKQTWKPAYLFYGLAIIALYVFLATTQLDVFPLDVLKIFYEITNLAWHFWGLVAIISLTSAVLLFLTQKLRELAVKK
jgi:cation-transporting P-type ATPase E